MAHHYHKADRQPRHWPSLSLVPRPLERGGMAQSGAARLGLARIGTTRSGAVRSGGSGGSGVERSGTERSGGSGVERREWSGAEWSVRRRRHAYACSLPPRSASRSPSGRARLEGERAARRVACARHRVAPRAFSRLWSRSSGSRSAAPPAAIWLPIP